ncbi:ficolin-1-like [Ruditapes philippinarum]|uniref:ficolin-1-like n=1 Tax=Ruditapes philippinarum TaxID=129788 RepID=UPI00295BA7D4|nr:ficolin-1-like [Ruditapes philippinarum]
MASNGKTELRIDLTAADDTTTFSTFKDFYLGGGPYYNLHIKRGNAQLDSGYYGLSNSNGRPFSTFDVDRDNYSSRNCAVYNHGAWWYNGVGHINLNGDYVKPGSVRHTNRRAGMVYYLFQNNWTSLKVSKMMFRPV